MATYTIHTTKETATTYLNHSVYGSLTLIVYTTFSTNSTYRNPYSLQKVFSQSLSALAVTVVSSTLLTKYLRAWKKKVARRRRQICMVFTK
jgi:hypothetical protein